MSKRVRRLPFLQSPALGHECATKSHPKASAADGSVLDSGLEPKVPAPQVFPTPVRVPEDDT